MGNSYQLGVLTWISRHEIVFEYSKPVQAKEQLKKDHADRW